MKMLIALVALVSFSARAELCSRYDSKPEYINALTALAKHVDMSMDEVCNHPRIMDIQIHPSQIINRQGEVIPQIAIYFHYSEHSCKYLLNRQDLSMTESRCFNTW